MLPACDFDLFADLADRSLPACSFRRTHLVRAASGSTAGCPGATMFKSRFGGGTAALSKPKLLGGFLPVASVTRRSAWSGLYCQKVQ